MISSSGKKKLNRLIRVLRWPIIALIGVWFLFLEILEHPGAFTQLDTTFLSEVVIIEGSLIAVGVAISWFLSTILEKSTTVNILEAKNDLSRRLATAQDWDRMASLLVEYPRSVMPLSAASLFSYSKLNEQYELTAYWSADTDRKGVSSRITETARCMQCAYTQPFVLRPVGTLCSSETSNSDFEDDYCLPLAYGDSMRAILQLRLPPGSKPTTEQIKMLNSLGPEMAIALRAAQANHAREQLAAERAAEAVRQEITRDMHDMLAQNLAYMQLKLDQITHRDQPPQTDDLLKLRDVADESYELVRSTLSALHPNNLRRLGDILSEHAYSFAERAQFEVIFTQEGQSQPLEPLVINHVYQLYRETLNNIGKHAQADLVETKLFWKKNGFDLIISDDGIGFDTQSVNSDDHFGLEFMQGRVEELQGNFSLDSIPGKGTTITISIPTNHKETVLNSSSS